MKKGLFWVLILFWVSILILAGGSVGAATAADFLGLPLPEIQDLLPPPPPRPPAPLPGWGAAPRPPLAGPLIRTAASLPPPQSLTCEFRAEAAALGGEIPRADLLGLPFRVLRASATHMSRPDGSVSFDVVVMQVEARNREQFVLVHTVGLPWLDLIFSHPAGELPLERLRWGSRDPAAMTSPAAALGVRIQSGPLLGIALIPYC